MTLYQCPRSDLGCRATFPTSGDLDFHLHQEHHYGRLERFTSSLARTTTLPVGPKPARRVPDGLEGGAGTPTTARARQEHARRMKGGEATPVGRRPAGKGKLAAAGGRSAGERGRRGHG
ncbi:hypothetical protein UG55_100547 [Frankia sp. EI5c]|uniref:hypothetical protein n=1 Tax=Frankia sp. EI5c TaxID=683316 RepID=UPI0007C21A47|nr:hypothetical protein [Frankia sp. EI5c]OAA28535.1 hypothetical protein UG55_100547 [Frankia sp. EI5c]